MLKVCGDKDSGTTSQIKNQRVYARKKVWTKLKNGLLLFAWRIVKPRQLPGNNTVRSTAEQEPLLTFSKQKKYSGNRSDANKNEVYSNKRE